MIAKQIVNDHWDRHINGVGLAVAQGGQVSIVNSLDYWLSESLFKVIAFVEKSNLLIVSGLLCLHDVWELICWDYQ